MTRGQLIALFGGFLGLVAFAYFALIVSRPEPLARVLLRRGYEQRGYTEKQLALRLRVLGVLGVVVALLVILLAVVRFVG